MFNELCAPDLSYKNVKTTCCKPFSSSDSGFFNRPLYVMRHLLYGVKHSTFSPGILFGSCNGLLAVVIGYSGNVNVRPSFNLRYKWTSPTF